MIRLFLGAVLRFVQWLFGGWRPVATTYGSARFMKRRERTATVGAHLGGFVVDGFNQLSRRQSMQHCAAFAGSGKGKTTGMVLPSVLRFLESGDASLVVTDPSGEILRATSGYAKACGYRINVLNYADPERSHRHNPFARLKTASERYEMASELIGLKFPSGQGEQSFWNTGSAKWNYVLLEALQRCDPACVASCPATLLSLLEQFSFEEEAFRQFNAFIYDQWSPDSPEDQLWQRYRSLVEQPPNTVLGFLSTAQMALSSFIDPAWCRFTARDDLNLARMRTEKTITYLILPATKQQFSGFLVNLFYRQLFNELLEMPEGAESLDLFLILDEFANVGVIPGFVNIISTIRKRRVGIMLVLQSKFQLYDLYGRDKAEVIMDNLGTRLYYPGQNYKVAEELSRSLGKATIRVGETGFSRRGEEASTSRERQQGRDLMTPDEIMRMQGVLMHMPDRYPLRLTMTPADKNPYFRARMQHPPVALPDHRGDPTPVVQLPESTQRGAAASMAMQSLMSAVKGRSRS